jgi:hypothetical protein
VNELVDAGCDVITCHLDSPRVAIETAEARGVGTCGHAFDQTKLAPKGYITGAEYRWIEMFQGFVETLQKGGTLPNYVIGGYDKDYVRSSPFGADRLPGRGCHRHPAVTSAPWTGAAGLTGATDSADESQSDSVCYTARPNGFRPAGAGPRPYLFLRPCPNCHRLLR